MIEDVARRVWARFLYMTCLLFDHRPYAPREQRTTCTRCKREISRLGGAWW